jgi:hypothetical protein
LCLAKAVGLNESIPDENVGLRICIKFATSQRAANWQPHLEVFIHYPSGGLFDSCESARRVIFGVKNVTVGETGKSHRWIAASPPFDKLAAPEVGMDGIYDVTGFDQFAEAQDVEITDPPPGAMPRVKGIECFLHLTAPSTMLISSSVRP